MHAAGFRGFERSSDCARQIVISRLQIFPKAVWLFTRATWLNAEVPSVSVLHVAFATRQANALHNGFAKPNALQLQHLVGLGYWTVPDRPVPVDVA